MWSNCRQIRDTTIVNHTTVFDWHEPHHTIQCVCVWLKHWMKTISTPFMIVNWPNGVWRQINANQNENMDLWIAILKIYEFGVHCLAAFLTCCPSVCRIHINGHFVLDTQWLNRGKRFLTHSIHTQTLLCTTLKESAIKNNARATSLIQKYNHKWRKKQKKMCNILEHTQPHRPTTAIFFYYY